MGAGPEDDLVKALDRWLTKGIAPERIIATKFENDNEAGRIIRSRPLCPFPKMARWSGLGSIDDNATFRCVEP
jgi:feruloyl esterase